MRPNLIAALALGLAAGLGAAQAAPLIAFDDDGGPHAEGDWSLSVASERHSDALALSVLDGARARQLQPRSGRNLTYAEDEIRASRRMGAWRWSLLARQSVTIDASEQTLRLAQALDQPGPRASGQWQADARYRGFAGAGLEVARAWSLTEHWQWQASLQALTLGRWRERTLRGDARLDAANGTGTGTDTYAFNLASQQVDDHLRTPFQAPFAARGQALLAGVDLRWHSGDWRARLALSDLGWLHWSGVPQQDAVLSTLTQAVDADGFVIYQPLVQGQNRQSGLTRSAPVQSLLALDWAATPQRRLGLAVRMRGTPTVLPALQWAEQVGAARLGLQWQWHERRLSLQGHWQGWQWRLGADRLDAAARSREVGLAWSGAL